MNFISKNKKPIIIIVVVVIVILLVILLIKTGKKSDTTNGDVQAQIENSKELKPFVDSPRNNFTKGKYSLNTSKSKVNWKYGTLSGSIPVNSGKLEVLDSGRIAGFNVDLQVSKIQMNNPDKSTLDMITTKILDISKYPTGSMTASTVLPNTVDSAFSVAFSLSAAGKSTSVATGMNVSGTPNSVKISGETTLDPKSFGFPDSKDTLVISPEYIFEN